jgi:AmmeMemoRadiSam system protein B
MPLQQTSQRCYGGSGADRNGDRGRSDLSHYHDYDTRGGSVRKTAAAIERGDWQSLGPDQACGFLAVAGLIVETNRRRLAPRRLALCNSGDTAGGRERVVGYGAWMIEDTAAAT